MAIPLHVTLAQIRPERRVDDPARALALGWYVARHDEDRYDETTEYRVGLFDVRTGEELTCFVTSVHERADTGARHGEHLESAAFDPDDPDRIVLRFQDGSEERVRLDDAFASLDHDPAEDGVEVSAAERRIRERLRVEAERLRARLRSG